MSDRRTFLKQMAATMTVLAASPTGYAQENQARPAAAGAKPAKPNPGSSGVERYDAEVPDTLELTERCALALHGVAGQTDPDVYYQMWFTVAYCARNPYLSHGGADGTCTPKFAESFPLLRYASGSDEFQELEQGQMDNLIANINDQDGLYYTVWKPDRPWHSDYMGHEKKNEDYAQVAGVARMMQAMMTWQERDGDEKWTPMIQKMVRGLDKIAIHRDGYAYYPDGGHSVQFAYPKSGWMREDEPQSDAESREGSVLDTLGRPAYALARWYKKSGDEESLELARLLTNFVMKEKMWGALVEDVAIDSSEQGHFYSHLHGHLATVRGLLEYGDAARDQYVIEFARRSYEGARQYMIPRIGWAGAPGLGDTGIAMEACALGDLCALGVRLSDYGAGDYWDDVDALARNMLVEQQLADLGQLQRIAKAAGGGGPSSSQPKRETGDDMPERIVGIFASFSLPNRLPAGSVMGCCTANATQGLYYAWESAIRCDGDVATVNLLVNRASPLVDVDSYIPYEGRVVIRNKKAGRAQVRILGWIDRRQLRVTVAGQDRPLHWAGNFLVIDDLKPSDVIELTFPVPESRSTYTAHYKVWRQQQDYTFTFLGSTCIDVEPKTHNPLDIPIFQRSAMRGKKAPMRKIARVVNPSPPLGY